MRSVRGSIAVLVFFAAACCAGGGEAYGAGQQPPKPPPPAKKPADPVDPNATAGVRGPGIPIKIEVRYKRKPVDGASVLAKNPDGKLAGSCTTDSTGMCVLSVGAGEYSFSAAQNGLVGTISAQVTAAAKPVAITLAKVKPPQ